MTDNLSTQTRATVVRALAVDNWVSEVVLHGALDSMQWATALDTLLEKSENLRFTLSSIDSEGRPQECTPAPHSLIDLSQHSDPRAAYQTLVAESASRSFDLTTRSCLSQLVCIGLEEHIWLLVQHPLVSDATSQRLLAQQLASVIANSNSGAPLPGTPPSRQSAFRQSYLADEQSAEDLEFFRPRLSRAIEAHRFYNSCPSSDPAVNTLRQVSEITPQQLVMLEAHTDGSNRGAEQHLAVFFQTVLLGMLRLLGGNREQAVGVALRDALPPSGPCMGNFTEWVPLWVKLEDSDSFASLAERVQREYQSLLHHSRGAISTCNTNGAACFEVLCNVEKDLRLLSDGLNGSQVLSRGGNYFSARSHFPAHRAAISLDVILSASGGNSRLVFDFDAQRFGERDAQRLVQHFTALMDNALTDWSRPLDVALLLSDEERGQLLALNPAPVPTGRDVIEGFEFQVDRVPDNRAVLFGAQSMSYQQLNARANRIAHSMRARGVRADDWVAIALDRGIDLISALIACLKVGATYVPLDPSHPASRNCMVLEVADPKLLLTNCAQGPELKSLAQCSHACVEDLLENASEAEANGSKNVRPEDSSRNRLAYVIFTSGSTGKPKGVEVPRAALANLLTSMQQEPGFSDSDALLSLTTISFDIATLEVFLPLVSGGWLEMGDRLFSLDPLAVIKRLDSGDFTVLQATPATWRMLVEARWGGSKNLKAITGGEALSRTLATQLCERTRELWNCYGPTETTIYSTAEKISLDNGVIAIGHPIANTQAYVLDEKGSLMPHGVVGELVIGGVGVARGYAGLPKLTAEKFRNDPFSTVAGARMYRTGDRARWLENGTLECLGRLDFQVKIRGFRIELGEIEMAIASHGFFAEALVLAKEVTKGSLDLIAYGKSSPGFEEGALREFLRKRLPDYMVPAFFVAVDKWPLTHSGKIDRRELPTPDTANRTRRSVEVEPVETELESRIAKIWCDTLDVPTVGRNEDLFASGGNSLSAVRLLLGLAAMPGGEISLGAFLKDPTVRGAAMAMEDGSSEERSVVVALNQTTVADSGKAPLFCICGVHLYSEVATAMPERPVLGVYLPLERFLLGLEETDNAPLPTMEEMAASYIEAVVEEQPTGPYFLSGLSLGGMLAFEMTRQLRAKGETVELLAMFDSILPTARTFQRRAWAIDHVRRGTAQGPYLWRHAGVARRLAPVWNRFKRAKAWLTGSQLDVAEAQADSERQSKTQEQQHWVERRGGQIAIFDQIAEEHEPRMKPMPGEATFFRAVDDSERAGIRVEANGGWHRWVEGKLTVHELQADHMGVLKGESAKKIAAVLTDLAANSKSGGRANLVSDSE